SLEGFLDDLAQGSRANGQSDGNASKFTITDDGITATSAQTLTTGAERVTWTRKPNVTVRSGAEAHYSTDDGATWSTAQPDALPAPLDGLMYWTIPLGTRDTFTGIDIIEPSLTPPTLAPIADVELQQTETATRDLEYTVDGTEWTWEIQAGSLVQINRVSGTLNFTAGYTVGTEPV